MLDRKPWDHGGKTRHQRGYGRQHVKLRAQPITPLFSEPAPNMNGGGPFEYLDALKRGPPPNRNNFETKLFIRVKESDHA